MIENSQTIHPSFFIIGAPKCGTTSLATYLSQHPHVVMSVPKEPHYFSSDIHNGRVQDFDEYLHCFRINSKQAKIAGEASTLYMFSSVAIPEILKFNPTSKFIIMLRNPVEFVYSYYFVALNIFGETTTDFEAAWRLGFEREKGNKIPKPCPDPKLLFYHSIGKLGEQVSRLLGIIKRNQVHFIVFDQFISNTRHEFEKVLQFLNLDLSQDFEMKIHNKTRRSTFPKVLPILHYFALLKRKIGIKSSFGIANMTRKIISSDSKPASLSLEFQNELANYFRNDIELLSGLIEKDLTHWFKQYE